ncbi:hypothetical protein [Paraburkholderia sp. J11-2]|uniref:hypothetical protein n=1 Tax=Paraburkholderia sp. J11-2 TaxID=2805431 RepID=UPI002AB730F8|nr:hypothetical protein [Paraburkholderia sp. J11-2]
MIEPSIVSNASTAGDERPRNEYPVRAIGDVLLPVVTAQGSGTVPMFVGGCTASERATRALVVLHGRLRDADAYLRSTLRARAASSAHDDATLVVVPQFLASADVEHHHRAHANFLHWEWTAWMGGADARGPAPLSSFDALDALVAQLADRSRYPALREIVIAGHSGGAQVAHRYAILSAAPEPCARLGVPLRFVIANPSSWVYFDSLRPQPDGGFGPADRAACPDLDDWKYGMRKLPRYAAATRDATMLEHRYIGREVVYLAGERDCDPAHAALDRSCAANAQGPHRLARARAYYAYLRARHPQLRHTWFEVPGAGHNAEAMFLSEPGIRALFGAHATIDAARAADQSRGAGGADD